MRDAGVALLQLGVTARPVGLLVVVVSVPLLLGAPCSSGGGRAELDDLRARVDAPGSDRG